MPNELRYRYSYLNYCEIRFFDAGSEFHVYFQFLIGDRLFVVALFARNINEKKFSCTGWHVASLSGSFFLNGGKYS